MNADPLAVNTMVRSDFISHLGIFRTAIARTAATVPPHSGRQ